MRRLTFVIEITEEMIYGRYLNEYELDCTMVDVLNALRETFREKTDKIVRHKIDIEEVK